MIVVSPPGDFDQKTQLPAASWCPIENESTPHGDADDRIKVEYGRQIFANLACAGKELHIIPGAGHFDVMARGGAAYRRALLQFLERNR